MRVSAMAMVEYMLAQLNPAHVQKMLDCKPEVYRKLMEEALHWVECFGAFAEDLPALDDVCEALEQYKLYCHRCMCGAWSGVTCPWVGPRAKMMVVDFMPRFMRKDRTWFQGIYPLNGAVRIRVEQDCGRRMIEEDVEWCTITENHSVS